MLLPMRTKKKNFFEKAKTPPGFEPGLLESKSSVITTRLRSRGLRVMGTLLTYSLVALLEFEIERCDPQKSTSATAVPRLSISRRCRLLESSMITYSALAMNALQL